MYVTLAIFYFIRLGSLNSSRHFSIVPAQSLVIFRDDTLPYNLLTFS